MGRRDRNEGEIRRPLPHLRRSARLVGGIVAALLRSLGATWRRETEGVERLDRLLAGGRRVMVVFWHGQYLPLFLLFAGRSACIFTSRSFRGEVIAAVSNNFGNQGAPLPKPSRGKVLDSMRRILTGCRVAAFAVDGPLGPYRIVKPGVVRLASDLGFSVLPVATVARRAWVLSRRWDRMEIPRPFARVRLVCGPPVRIPAGLPEEEVESWCELLRKRLEAAERRARRATGER